MPPPDHCHIVAVRGRLLADLWQDCASNATRFADGGRPEGAGFVMSWSRLRWRPRRSPPRPGLRRNCFSYLALRYASREAGYTPRSPPGCHPPASPCCSFWHKPLLIKMLCRCQPCQPFGRFSPSAFLTGCGRKWPGCRPKCPPVGPRLQRGLPRRHPPIPAEFRRPPTPGTALLFPSWKNVVVARGSVVVRDDGNYVEREHAEVIDPAALAEAFCAAAEPGAALFAPVGGDRAVGDALR